MKKTRVLIGIIFLNVMHFSFSFEDFYYLTSNLSSEERSTLQSGSALTSTTSQWDSRRLRYSPNLPFFDELKKFTKSKRPQILYESMFFLKEVDEEKRKELYMLVANQLLDVPILATIEYTNLKDGNVHPLFKSSNAVASKNSSNEVPPPSPLTEYPQQYSEQKIYIRQDMPPFGAVGSRYEYKYDTSYFQFIGRNTSPISYKGIKAVKPEHMYTASWIINTDEGIIIYGIGTTRISGIAGFLGGIISNSFTSRMVGLFKWLNEKIAQAQSSE